MREKSVSVAAYLRQQIDISPKSQSEICEDIGLDKPNIITMFKQGKTKVPVTRVPALARALNIDPVYLLSLVMSEYTPETWQVIQDVVGGNLISQKEMSILKLIREASEGRDVAPENSDEKQALISLVDGWVARDIKDVEALKGLKELK
jgi:transcriptional regulator with XRE-family HTH domain